MSRDYQEAITKDIKAALVSHFSWPFSVTKSRGSRYINVRWTDGPTSEAVNTFTRKFNDDGNDDIMTDLFVGSQYTNCHRHFSNDAAYPLLFKIDLRFDKPALSELVAAAMDNIARGYQGKLTSNVSADGKTAGLYCEKPWLLEEMAEAFNALGYKTAIVEHVLSVEAI